MPNITFKPGVKFTPHDVPKLFAEDYYSPDFPVQIYHVDYSNFNAPMYLNDQLGDCTCAGMGHCAGGQSNFGSGAELLFSDSQIEKLYEGSCGYVPGDPQTDQGGTLEGVLSYTKANPSVIPGYNLDAYAQLRNLSWAGLTTGLKLFGTVYVAVNLPQSAEDQFNAGEPWTVSGNGNIAGGHCICLTGFVGGTNSARWATWGKPDQPASMQWWNQYGVEAWVPYSKTWLRANGVAPNGLNETALLADMKSIVGD